MSISIFWFKRVILHLNNHIRILWKDKNLKWTSTKGERSPNWLLHIFEFPCSLSGQLFCCVLHSQKDLTINGFRAFTLWVNLYVALVCFIIYICGTKTPSLAFGVIMKKRMALLMKHYLIAMSTLCSTKKQGSSKLKRR